MKEKIEHPKVFISYAWGSKEYQDEVLSFAYKLQSDGIEVIIDKWSLSEGNDTYAFMEKCVTDPSITNVLVLLDPIYAKKADEHTGGVGTETQIISAQVYQQVDQDKFIPVIMRLGDDGSICKPTYWKGRLHFDLTKPEEYDETYKRLVRTLYGRETYEKPELGKRPTWVDQPLKIQSKVYSGTVLLRNPIDSRTKKKTFSSLLGEIKEDLNAFAKNSTSSLNSEEYIKLYDQSEEIRNSFLEIINNAEYVEDGAKIIAIFFEDAYNDVQSISSLESEMVRVRIHEMFIYTIACFLKEKNYKDAGYLLGRTYFDGKNALPENDADSFGLFYSGREHTNLDSAIIKRDNKNYHTGTGQHWIETLALDYCTREQFVFADLICYNYSMYGKYYLHWWSWFPISYIYANEYENLLASFAKRMISKEQLEEILPLFGYETKESFIEKAKAIESDPNLRQRKTGYPGAFNSPQLLCDFIKADKIATVK